MTSTKGSKLSLGLGLAQILLELPTGTAVPDACITTMDSKPMKTGRFSRKLKKLV
jgi:hypothetical protein